MSDVIRISTGKHRTITGAIAAATAARVKPGDEVTWRCRVRWTRWDASLVRALVAYGRRCGLDVELTTTHAGLWIREGHLTSTGPWTAIARFARFAESLSGLL